MSAVEVQRAFWAAISGLGLTVYDSAPQIAAGGAPAPLYVEVGAIVMVDWDTARESGFDFIARIHTRSTSGSMLACKTAQDQMYARLHNGALAVTGFSTILLQREMSDCTRESDGSFHGICEYRGLIEKVA